MRHGVSNSADPVVGVATHFSPRPPTVERDHVGLAALSARFEWQTALFAPQPDRRVLLGLNAPWPTSPRRIRFHRNHAIEYSLSVLRPFLEYAGIRPELLVGDYDDSLSFASAGDADVEVVWLDYARFADRLSPDAVASWLGTRIAALRTRTSAPVLVLDWDGRADGADEFSQRFRSCVGGLGDVRLADRRELFNDLAPAYFDPERASVTGTRMSRQGAILTARLLGSRWLPALLEPRLKAVVVDLDNTLYDGVLGEDGAEAVVLTEAHAMLQRELLRLRDSGLFVALLSRNDPADVQALFAERTDFPLRWDDFSAHSVSWQPKSDGLEYIAHTLRIHQDAMLFVDDNAGELLQTLQHNPDLRCLHAKQDASETVSCLRYFPALWTFDGTREDTLRVADTRANKERARAVAAATGDLASYYRELGVVLTVGHNRDEQVRRVAELSGKTNQFNLAIRRYGEPELRSLLATDDWQLSTAQLEDRLTDSGVIALAVSERRERTLIVHDLCISCRALGRQLEDLIVAQMLVSGPLFDGTTEVSFPYVAGPRNQPARRWLSQFGDVEISPDSKSLRVAVASQRLLDASVNPHVRIGVLG